MDNDLQKSFPERLMLDLHSSASLEKIKNFFLKLRQNI